ncbi:hypothetical protein NLI96_g1828 [Meripilus lineatus]|uniref:Uncharacterized protein n=1 Tax=Meripilus lineatus TaxID=2056292 RepID=A0AAD5YKK2_9APHY|nr:hypothetical protein NLI96_g1828 [Physisporinus lineatus]
MATYYSAFFSSGLLASHDMSFAVTAKDTPSTPRPRQHRLPEDNETTPTAHSIPEAVPTTTERPRMRRRRSSVTTSASPVTAIKTAPTPRTAAPSLQRLTLLSSPSSVRTRSRSGSVTDSFIGRTSMTSNEATQANSLIGRMRSGSVGNALRYASHLSSHEFTRSYNQLHSSRKSLRKNATVPAPPPPTAPLPALPISIICPSSNSSSCSPSTPRRPLARRAQPSDNLMIPLNTPPALSMSPLRGDDFSIPSSPITAPGLSSGDLLFPLPRGLLTILVPSTHQEISPCPAIFLRSTSK